MKIKNMYDPADDFIAAEEWAERCERQAEIDDYYATDEVDAIMQGDYE